MGLCSDCATRGKTCCQRSDIIVTEGDIRRIEIALHPKEPFWEWRKARCDDYCQNEDPNWDSYTLRADGTRRMLRLKSNGDCLFLSEQGCLLPLQARPLICRLYPYHYSEAGLMGLDPYKCPPGALSEDPESLPPEFGLSPEAARSWQAQFYAELREDAEKGRTGS